MYFVSGSALPLTSNLLFASAIAHIPLCFESLFFLLMSHILLEVTGCSEAPSFSLALLSSEAFPEFMMDN